KILNSTELIGNSRNYIVYNVLKEPATAQQTFSFAKHPTAWRTIPTLECLANRWKLMAIQVLDPNYKLAYVEGKWSPEELESGVTCLEAAVCIDYNALQI
ncbi:hypothetical protein AZE42_00968, partial [Rhizopogon vesiculosus]